MKSAVIIFLVIAMSGIIHSATLELDNDIDRSRRACTIVGEAEFCYYRKPYLNFGQGEEFCKTKSGHLASINSKREQNAVTRLIKSNSGGSNFTWIGYIDNKASGLDWNWIDGMGGYTNWYTNYPVHPGYYMCAVHYKANGQWLSTYCYYRYSVLCRMYSMIDKKNTSSLVRSEFMIVFQSSLIVFIVFLLFY